MKIQINSYISNINFLVKYVLVHIILQSLVKSSYLTGKMNLNPENLVTFCNEILQI